MRRMITNKQVVDIVNKGIEEGEIEAGGLTPEQEEKLDNSLQLPESAPATQQLVGINTSGEQNALSIGDGLEISNNTISVPVEIIKLDCQNNSLTNQSNSLAISDELAAKLQQLTTIAMLTNVNSNFINGMLFAHRYANTVLYNITLGGDTSYDSAVTNGAQYQLMKRVTLRINGSAGGYYLTISQESYQGIVTKVEDQYTLSIVQFTLDSLTGTKTMPSALRDSSQNKTWSHLLLNNGSQYVRLFIQYIDRSNPFHLFAAGEDATYKYTLDWYGTQDGTAHAAGEYTITQVAK